MTVSNRSQIIFLKNVSPELNLSNAGENIRIVDNHLGFVPSDETYVVLVVDSDESMEFLQILRLQSLEGLQIWIISSQLRAACTVLRNEDAWEIHAVSIEGAWVKLELARGGNAGYDADLFFEGLLLGVLLEKPGHQASRGEFTGNSVPSDSLPLLMLLFRIGKPLKRYLPKKMVATAYKFLNKVRAK